MAQRLALGLNILHLLRTFGPVFLYETGLLLYIRALFLNVRDGGHLIYAIKEQLARINSPGCDV